PEQGGAGPGKPVSLQGRPGARPRSGSESQPRGRQGRRIRAAEPPPAEPGPSALTAGARVIKGSPVVRGSLLSVAIINFFNFVFFALFVLYATRSLHVRPCPLGLVLGAGAVGGVLGALCTKRLSARLGAGRLYTASCLVFTAPLVLLPLAG